MGRQSANRAAPGEQPVGYHRDLLDLLAGLRHDSGNPSLRAMARDAHVAPSHVHAIFKGKKIPSAEVAAAIAAALGALPEKQDRARRYAEGAANDRDATAAARGARQVNDASVVLTGPPARSPYLQQVRRIAPDVLLGREDELEELTRFCTGSHERSYMWWRAPAWAGKSALMSWCVLHPPPRARILSFFITARYAGQSDRLAFVDVVFEQAAEVVGESMRFFRTEATRDVHFLDLLERAAETSQQEDQRLVLLVDGLDEDRGLINAAEGQSIAALLPSRPPAGMRIVVASRPHPPIPADVLDDHPLRDPGIVRTLAPSPQAAVIRTDMNRELMRLLHGTELEQDLLGLVTAAGGGLSGKDLAELTGWDVWQIEEHLGTVAGRSFVRRTSQWQSYEAPTEVYILGHEDLQAAAAGFLGRVRLDGFRQRLHTWADDYRDRSWPDDTPEYVLRGYYQMLRDTEDLPRMVICATDPARHDRMLDISGGDTAALAEITTVQDMSCRVNSLDLRSMAMVALHRDLLRQRNVNIPTGLPAAWALLGQSNRADALIGAITDPKQRTEALTALVRALADVGEFDQAEVLASSIADSYDKAGALDHLVEAVVTAGDINRAENLARSAFAPDYKDRALACLVDAVAAAGEFDRAQTLADSIPVLHQKMQALAFLVERLTHAGDIEWARTVAERAQELSRSETDAGWRKLTLVFLVKAVAATGDFDRAEALARAITDTRGKAEALRHVVEAVAAAGDLDRAENLARSISQDSRDSDSEASWALARVAEAATRVGDVDRAERLVRVLDDPHPFYYTLLHMVEIVAATGDLDRAKTLARTLTDADPSREKYLADALTALAKEAARAGRLIQAEKVISSIDNTFGQAYALTAVAQAVASTGRIDQARSIAVRAETLARSINSVGWRNQALTALAQALAVAGQIEMASGLARRITDRGRQADALTFVVKSIIATGDLDEAETLASSIANTADRDYRGRAMAPIAVALAANGDLDRAKSIIFDVIRSLNWQVGPIIALAQAHARNGEFDQAEYFAGLVSHDNWQEPFAALVEAASSTDFPYAEALARSISDKYWRAKALSHLLEAAGRANDFDRARLLSEEAETLIGPVVGPPDHVWLWDTYVDEAARLGTLSGSIPQIYRQGHALIVLARSLTNVGEFHRAEGLTRSITDRIRRGEAMADLVEAAARSGHFNWADTLAESISDPARLRVEALARLAKEAARAGDIDRAREITLRAETVAQSITNSDDKAESLIRLMAAVAATGDFDRAEYLARAVTDPDRQAEALAALATGDQARARRLLAWAFRTGTWMTPLRMVAVVEPEVLPAVATAFVDFVLPPADDDSNELSHQTSLPLFDNKTKYTVTIINE